MFSGDERNRFVSDYILVYGADLRKNSRDESFWIDWCRYLKEEMNVAEQAIWGIHIQTDAGNKLFLEKGYVAIGWPQAGDLSMIGQDREAFKAAVAKLYPDKSSAYIGITTGQLFRFASEMKPGDWIVYRATYFDGLVHIGKIKGPYEYQPSWLPDYPNVHKVEWLKSFPVTRFTQGALYELGAAMTLFQLKNYGDEYVAAVEGQSTGPVAPDDDETVAQVAVDIGQNTEDFILKELQRHLKGFKMEGFVADLLRTMGYRTSENKPGPDEGIDIVAYKDELRLLPPIVKVQVKSGDGTIGRPKVQELFGTLAGGEYGLVVSLGGFAPQAKDFAKSRSTLRLIDGPALVEIILEHYEELQPRYKALIPLKRVYIPQPAANDSLHE